VKRAREPVEVDFVCIFLVLFSSRLFLLSRFIYFFQVISSAAGRNKVTPLCTIMGNEQKYVRYVF